MKKIFFLYLLLVSLATSGQTDTTKIKIVEPPDSTAIGTPDGKLVSKQIGPTGGAIASDDGRVELIFPAGALITNTTISIQPTTNPAPNGTGKAYQFEPSGTQFKKPVQIIFHYTDEEAKTCPADLMGFALQDHTGKWAFIDYDDWDSTGKTLKGFIQHFSGGSNVNQLVLRPVSAILSTGEETLLSLIVFSPKSKKNPGKGKILHIGMLSIDQRIRDFEVNKVFYGNEYVGKILPGQVYDVNIKKKTYSENYLYKAPKFLPDENPVTITATIFLVDNNGDVISEQKTLSCKIEIYDEYKVLIRDTSEARVGFGKFIVDSGSFVVKITNKGIILKDIKNYRPYSYKLFEPPRPFKMDVYTEDPCLGTINIGAYSAQIIDKKKNKPPYVLITFNPDEILAFRILVQARGIKSKNEPIMLQPLPDLIDFEANGQPQSFIREKNVSHSIYITPISDE